MCRRPGCCATAATTACGWASTCSCWRGAPCLAAGSSGCGAAIAGCSRWGSILRPEPAVQITAQMQVGRMGAVQQLLFDHLLFVRLGLEGLGHVIVEYPYPGHVAAIEPRLSYPLLYLPRIQRLLRRQAAPAHAGQLIALQLAELALDQILVDQRVAVVEGQGQGAARAHQCAQVGQGGSWVGQPFQYRMTDNQIMTLPPFGQPLQWQVNGLPWRCLYPHRLQPGPGGLEHFDRGFADGQSVALAQQPLAHMTESCTYVEDIQRAVAGQLGQPLAKIALQHGQADGALGAGVDLAREVRAQLIKVAISHVKVRRNNS